MIIIQFTQLYTFIMKEIVAFAKNIHRCFLTQFSKWLTDNIPKNIQNMVYFSLHQLKYITNTCI